MMNKLLISWSLVISVAILVMGAWIAFSPHGVFPAGIALSVIAALLGFLGTTLAREEWGRYQLRSGIQRGSSAFVAERKGRYAQAQAPTRRAGAKMDTAITPTA